MLIQWRRAAIRTLIDFKVSVCGAHWRSWHSVAAIAETEAIYTDEEFAAKAFFHLFISSTPPTVPHSHAHAEDNGKH